MVCTYCGGPTQVTNSRHKKRANIVWRRRECKQCGSLVTTEEAISYHTAWLVEDATGGLLPFLRDKLLISMYKCLAHRSAAPSEASHLVDTVIAELRGSEVAKQAVIPAKDIRRTILTVLERFDPLAAAQYLAYHKA